MALVFQSYSSTSQIYHSAAMGPVPHIFDTFAVYETTRELSLSVVQPFQGHIKAIAIADYVASASAIPDTMLYWSGSAVGLFGVYEHDSGSLLQAETMGPASHFDMFQPPDENHDRSTLTDESPYTLQGANNIEWDVFPTPPIVPSPPLRERDLTRYHKAYSFTRMQPVRIRLIRR